MGGDSNFSKDEGAKDEGAGAGSSQKRMDQKIAACVLFYNRQADQVELLVFQHDSDRTAIVSQAIYLGFSVFDVCVAHCQILFQFFCIAQ
jgi:hypothetical protein